MQTFSIQEMLPPEGHEALNITFKLTKAQMTAITNHVYEIVSAHDWKENPEYWHVDGSGHVHVLTNLHKYPDISSHLITLPPVSTAVGDWLEAHPDRIEHEDATPTILPLISNVVVKNIANDVRNKVKADVKNDKGNTAKQIMLQRQITSLEERLANLKAELASIS